MTSRSARIASERPFYDLHADVYDALITDPVEPWVDAVHEQLRSSGLSPAAVLDAGCGTGRHAAALIGRGHRVTLLDASAALLRIAGRRCPESPMLLTDLCTPATNDTFDAVVARGVLNDLLSDQERTDALASFARLTRSGGVLVLDVREAVASRRRADGIWRTTEVELANGCVLRFHSRPTWNAGRIAVEERYELACPDATPTVTEYSFAMRPWTRDEIVTRLGNAGYQRIEIRPGAGRRTPDRLFVTAQR